jgi:alcohol dehydrogenase (cytochrome c)
VAIKRFTVLGSAVLVLGIVPALLAQQPAQTSARTRVASYELTDGRTIEGVFLNHERADDVQLRTQNGSIVLLRKSGERYRVVTSGVDWPSYDGSTTGNRYTPLTQIDKSNVSRLAPKWIYTIPSTLRLQVTPVVVDGIMYVTSANECYALDAGNGREIWRFQQPRTKGLVGNAAGGINRVWLSQAIASSW